MWYSSITGTVLPQPRGSGYQNFCTSCRLPDIIVLSIYHYPRLPHIAELWVEKNNIFLLIHDLNDKLAGRVEKSALELTDTLNISNDLSGCDSLSFHLDEGVKELLK